MMSAGRSCAVAPDRKSFDLCDDAEGLDAGREVGLSVSENRFQYTKPVEDTKLGDSKLAGTIPAELKPVETKPEAAMVEKPIELVNGTGPPAEVVAA